MEEEVELVADIWFYVLTFLSTPEKARLFQISRKWRTFMSNPSAWSVVEFDLTKKTLKKNAENLFWKFFVTYCTSVIDLNIVVYFSPDILIREWYRPDLSFEQVVEQIFSIKSLRRLKIKCVHGSQYNDLKIEKQPACRDLQLLNLEGLVLSFADENLIFSAFPYLEEVYVTKLQSISCLSHLKRLQRLKLDFINEATKIVDLCPSLKYITYHKLGTRKPTIDQYRDTIIVNASVFENIFDLSLDQVKIVAPLITPYDLKRPYLTTLMEQASFNETILEYLVKEVGLDVNRVNYSEFQYRPHCTGTKQTTSPSENFAIEYPILPPIYKGSLPKVAKLLELGAHPDPGGKSLLGQVYNYSMLLKMFEYGANPNLPIDDNGTPAFMQIIGFVGDSAELIQKLVNAKCDVNYEDAVTKQTMLERAVRAKKVNSVQALLEAGAKVTKQCVMPLVANMPEKFVELLKLKHISHDMISMTDAVIAIQRGLAQHLEEYFEEYKDLRDENGLSLLHRLVLIWDELDKKNEFEPLETKSNQRWVQDENNFGRPPFTNYHLPSEMSRTFAKNVVTAEESYNKPISDPNLPSLPLEMPSFSNEKKTKNEPKTSPNFNFSLNNSIAFSFDQTSTEKPTEVTPTNPTRGFSFLDTNSASTTTPAIPANITLPELPSALSFDNQDKSNVGRRKKKSTPKVPTTLPGFGFLNNNSSSSTSSANSSESVTVPELPSLPTFTFSNTQTTPSNPVPTSNINDNTGPAVNSAGNQALAFDLSKLKSRGPPPKNRISTKVATWLNHFDSAVDLLKINIDAKTSNGETPLLLACKAKVKQPIKLKYVQSLLRRGADPKTFDNFNWTALHAALYMMDWDVAFELLKNGADINAQDRLGITPLMAVLYGFKHKQAFECDEFEANLKRVLKEYPVDLSLTEKTTKRTLLHLLCCVGGPDIVLSFAEKMNVNARDASGFTPLHYAIMFGNDQLIGPLITSGADVNAQTTSLKLTPLMLLLSMLSPSPYESYLTHYNTLMLGRYSPTIVDAHSQDGLVYFNPPWNSTMKWPGKFLTFIPRADSMIDLLLSKSDLTLKDVQNNNVLHMLSAFKKQSELDIKRYIARFPELDQLVNKQNESKMIPANVNWKRKKGDLFNVAPPEAEYPQSDDENIVATLRSILENKNDIDAFAWLKYHQLDGTGSNIDVDRYRDENGNTALHIACQFFHLGVLDTRHRNLESDTQAKFFCFCAFSLLDAGADPTVKNNKGETPLDYVPELMEFYKEIYPLLK